MPKFNTQAATVLYESFTAGSRLDPPVLDGNSLGLLVLHVSEGCNMGCTYCFADKGHYGSDKRSFMKLEVAINAVDAAIERYERIEAIKFFGGEPFLNLDVLEGVVKYVKSLLQKGCIEFLPKFYVVTNMTIYSRRVERFLNSAVIHLVGSIDGPSSIHDKYRIFSDGRGTFDVVDRNIKKMKLDTGQPSVLEAVYTPAHLALGISMTELHKYLRERYSVAEIAIHPQTGIKQEDKVARVFSERIREVSEEYAQFRFDLAIKDRRLDKVRAVLNDYCASAHEDLHCGLGVQMLTVRADGGVYPCYTLSGFDEYRMADKLSEVGVKFDEVQHEFLGNAKSLIPECKSCDIVKTCRSCPGSMRQDMHSISKPVSTLCSFHIGTTEGILLGLNAARNDKQSWELVQQAVGNIC